MRIKCYIMIKSLLITFFALLTIQLSAQTEKGTILLGGQLLYSKTKELAGGYYQGNVVARRINLVPQVGFFIKDNLAFGTGLGYTSYKKDREVERQGLVVAPFGRYYARLWNDNLKFVGQLAFPIQILKNERYYYYNDNLQIYEVTASPGIVFFPAKKLGIELLFNGASFSKNSEHDEEFSFGDDLLSPMIGIQFHL